MRSRLMQYRSDPLMQNHSGVDTLCVEERVGIDYHRADPLPAENGK
jgi:hypothetical protein